MNIKKQSDNQDNTIIPDHLLLAVVLFGQAWSLWMRSFERSIHDAKLTVSQVTALEALYFAGRHMTPTEIARVLPLEVHSVSPLIDRLYHRKLVTRRHSKSDRRSVEVELTDEGKNLLRLIVPNLRSLMDDIFGSLTQQELSEFHKLVRKVSYSCADYLGVNKENLESNTALLVGASSKIKRSRKMKGK